MSKLKLNYRDISNRVQYVTKTKQDNNMIDRIGAVYTENKIEQLWLIGPSTTYNKNQTGQQYDKSYRYSLLQNQN